MESSARLPEPNEESRPVLVTGGAGFIGSHLVDALVSQGKKVVVLDDLSTGRRRNLSVPLKDRCDLIEMDLASAQAQSFVADLGPEVVYHLAAQKSVGLSVADPLQDARINIAGLIRLLEGLRTTRERTRQTVKIIFASSGGAVYSPETRIPTTESAATEPASPYGVTKLAAEKYLNIYAREHGLKWTALRLANVYGPRQDPKGEAGVIAIFSERALKNQPLLINGDGLQTRDYVYVVDVVKACLLAAASTRNQCINIGTGVETNVIEIAKLVGSAASSRSQLQHKAPRAGEPRRSCLDANLARQILNWQPTLKLEQGIEQTVAWFQDQYLASIKTPV